MVRLKECLRLPRLCCPGLPCFLIDFFTDWYPKAPRKRPWRRSDVLSWIFKASMFTALVVFFGLAFQLWYYNVYFTSREQVGTFRFA